jgi:bisanhydrobacterioruberin hydratase
MENSTRINKVSIAIGMAILFHLVGLVGILWWDRELIGKTTIFHLLLMFALLIWTEWPLTRGFIGYMIVAAVLGFGVEVLGVNTGLVFGDYSYGEVLGGKSWGVPWMIAVNWIIVTYGSACLMNALYHRIIPPLGDTPDSSNGSLTQPSHKPFSPFSILLLIDSAILATLFDWLMEPIAVKLGYWSWGGDGAIPLFNYGCWFAVSLLILAIGKALGCRFRNPFAVQLLLIQSLFFLALRILL